IIRARQKIFSRKRGRGSCTEHLVTHEWVEGRVRFAKSPTISPDLDSRQANSRTRNCTPIPRGIHGDRKWPDKVITRPSQRNKPEPSPNRNIIQKKFRQIAQKALMT